MLATLPREERESELQEARIERYQWALSAACILLVLEIFIRRRSKASIQLAVIIATTSLLLPIPSEAQELEPATAPTESLELPLPPTQESPEAIIHEPETDPRVLYNQAHAQLDAGDYAEATRLYEAAIELSEDVSLERDALYNMAHAINQVGEAALEAQDFEAAIESWKQAEALFKSANEIDSSDAISIEDATSIEARRNALEEFLKQQEPQEQEDQEDSEDSEESEDGEEGEEEEPEDGEEGEDQSEQSEEESGEEGDESEQGQDGDEQSDQEGDESESSAGEESDEPSEGEDTESTGDPAEDMEQQAEEEATSEGEEATDEESSESPQATEGTDGAEGDAGGEMMPMEGMSISEAQDLLDSLRGSEHLLPFSDPSDETRQSNSNRELRDW